MLVPSIADFYPLELPMMRPANAAFGVAGEAVYRTLSGSLLPSTLGTPGKGLKVPLRVSFSVKALP